MHFVIAVPGAIFAGGVIPLTKELAPVGIRVNIVTPGAIITLGADEGRKQLTAAIGITAEQLFSAVPVPHKGRAGTAANG